MNSRLGYGVYGKADAAASGVGVIGDCEGVDGTGVVGVSRSDSGFGCGVEGVAFSGRGVWGKGSTEGVLGQQDNTSGHGVRGLASASEGYTRGVSGENESINGVGVYGGAHNGSGTTYGVRGMADSPTGFGVYGSNTATTGAAGMALYGNGRLKVTGRSYLGTPNSVPLAADLDNGSISFYLDQKNNKLKVRVKYPTGVMKTAIIALGV